MLKDINIQAVQVAIPSFCS